MLSRPSASVWQPFNRVRRSAFTLVELVTAASIMSIIMIGVVEVFAVVTRTAAEAEGIHGAHQQMRVTLDRLNRDLRGATPEGYIRIDANKTTGTGSGEIAPYATNSLAFVGIGQCFGAYHPDTNRGAAAEILYTTNVATPTSFLQIKGTAVDHRRGVLARSAWLMDGQAGQALEEEDRSKAPYLGTLYASLGSASPLSVGRASTKIVPFLPGDAGTPNASLRRVMTTSTSQFRVEYWNSQDKQWKNETKTFLPGADDRPRAIRVTLAVHDPDDRGPLPDSGRYEGYVLQEVFWLGNP